MTCVYWKIWEEVAFWTEPWRTSKILTGKMEWREDVQRQEAERICVHMCSLNGSLALLRAR